MPLRLQLHLMISAMMAVLIALLIGLQIQNTRQSVREEIEASNIVATQLLSSFQKNSSQLQLNEMHAFLQQLGRVRANHIELYNDAHERIYQSPEPVYKAGRDAPAWFAQWVSPLITLHNIDLDQGFLSIHADPSRAILDGWDDFVPICEMVATGFVLANVLLYFLLGLVLNPIKKLTTALQDISEGHYHTRLAPMKGQETLRMVKAFNHMAQSLQDGLAAQVREQQALHALAVNRSVTQEIQTRVEAIQGQIARELHDELGQQVTAIKSVSLAIALKTKTQDPKIANSAQMIMDSADAIYQGMHQMISRMRPLVLDRISLVDALQDLLQESRQKHPQCLIELNSDDLPANLPHEVVTAIYRICQESITNAIRHAQPTRIQVWIRTSPSEIEITIDNDGQSPMLDWQSKGHFGVLGMQERARCLGGELNLQRRAPSGARVSARLPLAQEGISHEN